MKLNIPVQALQRERIRLLEAVNACDTLIKLSEEEAKPKENHQPPLVKTTSRAGESYDRKPSGWWTPYIISAIKAGLHEPIEMWPHVMEEAGLTPEDRRKFGQAISNAVRSGVVIRKGLKIYLKERGASE